MAAAPVAVLVSPQVYQLISILVGLAGVLIARQIFIDQENRQLRRKQSFRETLPLTLAATIIVGPVLVDNSLSVSLSAMLGLSVGYGTILFIKLGVKIWSGIFRDTAKTIAQQVLKTLESTPLPPTDNPQIDAEVAKLDEVDATPRRKL